MPEKKSLTSVQKAPFVGKQTASKRKLVKIAYGLLAVLFAAVALMLIRKPLLQLAKFSDVRYEDQKITADSQIKIYAGLKDRQPHVMIGDSEFLDDISVKDEKKVKELAYRLMALRVASKEINMNNPVASDIKEEIKQIAPNAEQKTIDRYKDYYEALAELSYRQRQLRNSLITQKEMTFVAVTWDLPKSLVDKTQANNILEYIYKPLLKQGKKARELSKLTMEPFFTKDTPTTTIKLDPSKGTVAYAQFHVLGKKSFGLLNFDDGMQRSIGEAVKGLKKDEISSIFELSSDTLAVARLDNSIGSGAFDTLDAYYNSLRSEFK